MLFTVISWIIILTIIMSLGIISSCLIKKLWGFGIKKISSILMLGIVLSTVYAELFSLFFKVEKQAVLFLVFLCGVGLICFRNQIPVFFVPLLRKINRNKVQSFCVLIVLICLILISAFQSSKYPGGYDTENYHAPSIRWIEEYGIVKGLGNLHSRFAYNSSFLCLQALFSFPYLFGQSMHSMNGFIWIFMVIYALFGLCLFRNQRFQLSDLLRTTFLIILLTEIYSISSPHTDLMPLCLAAYIFIEWTDLAELGQSDPVPYMLLAILGLFAASTKLSAGILGLFAVKPLWDFLKTKRFRSIVLFFAFGAFVLIPFLIRNLILSGYLLYPVQQTGFLSDIFQFDWVMPKSVAVSDNIMIKVFARAWGSNYGYSDIERSFFQWFPIWLKKANSYYAILGIVDLILSIILIPLTLFKIMKRRFCNYDVILLMGVVCFLFLLFSAPAVRFGKWYIWSLPVIVLFRIIPNSGAINAELKQVYNIYPVSVFLMITLVSIGIFWRYKVNISELSIYPLDYSKTGENSPYEVMNDQKIFYYFRDGQTYNLNSYYGFPGTECYNTLQRIEMRGDILLDGFRPKDEYKNIAYDFQGNILSADNIIQLKIEGIYDVDFMRSYRDPF